MKIRLPRVRPVLCCWFLPMGLTLFSVFSDVSAVSPFALPDVAGDVETTVAAPLRRRPKAFGTRVKVHREGAVEGKSVCAHKPYNLLHQLLATSGKTDVLHMFNFR